MLLTYLKKLAEHFAYFMFVCVVVLVVGTVAMIIFALIGGRDLIISVLYFYAVFLGILCVALNNRQEFIKLKNIWDSMLRKRD
jgi:phosphatidylglycerophosphate synthase